MEQVKKYSRIIAWILIGVLASIVGPDLYWLHVQHTAADTQAAAVALIQNAQKQQPPPAPAPSTDTKPNGGK